MLELTQRKIPIPQQMMIHFYSSLKLLTPFLILWLVFLKLRSSLSRIHPACILMVVIIAKRAGPGLLPYLPGLPGNHIVVNLHPVSPAGNAVQALRGPVGHDELSLVSELVAVSVWAEVIRNPIRESDRNYLDHVLDLEQVEPYRWSVGKEGQLPNFFLIAQS